MKLRGFMFVNEFVACGDPLTVVLGRNDSGKSRLLRKVIRVLAPRPEDRWADPGLPIIFVELSEDEKKRVFNGVNSANEKLDVVDGEFGTNFASVPYAGNAWLYSDVWDWVPLAMEWIQASCAERLDESLEMIVSLLSKSSTFALVPESGTWTFDEPPVRAFSIHWCIERADWESLAVRPDVRSAVEQAENGFTLLNPEPTYDRFSNPSSSPQWPPDEPDLERASDPTGTLPKPIVELGTISSLSHVLPITVPVGAGELERVVEKAVERVSGAWGLVYDPDGALPYTTARSPWLEKVDDDEVVRDAARVSRKVVEAVKALTREVNLQLPTFLSRKYEVQIGIRPIYEWDARGRIIIELRGIEGLPRISTYDPTRDTYDVTERFPHSDLADGYKLWFQLAVLRGVRLACRAASDEKRQTDGERHHPIPEFLGIDLYLLDEPERHLHAGLQREAARWLRNLLTSDAEQALLVSHSPAFISELGVEDTLIYIREGMAAARNISHVELEAAHDPARELGLTRGEMLTLIRCLLIAEGLTDQAVLETLFGDQLRRAGVQVVPIHGHSRTSKAVIDIGSLLLRFTDAEIAVWLDAVPDEFVKELVANPDKAGELRGNSPTPEAAAVASLVELAPRHALRVEPMANPAPDILFLLDEDAVRRVFPEYPGHHGAQIVKEDKNSNERSSEWFRRLLGKEKAPGAYVDIANEMIRSSTAPDLALTRVVDRCSELAGSIDDRPEWLPID